MLDQYPGMLASPIKQRSCALTSHMVWAALGRTPPLSLGVDLAQLQVGHRPHNLRKFQCGEK